MAQVDYSSCLFEARLQKTSFLRKNTFYYLYVSADKIMVNTEPYSKKPWLIFELLPTTHIKWLWEYKRNKSLSNSLKGFIIETEGHMYEFIAEKIVLQMLKEKFMEITLQSDFADEYALGKFIDKGNYAHVYECIKKYTGEKRAVKVLQKERLKTMKNGKDSVFNELKVLRSLKHDNLMNLYEVFEDRNKYYFVLQLLHGITLNREMQTRRKKNNLKSHQIRAIMRQLLEGLAYLQERGIMHRDVKPENILFQEKDSLDKSEARFGLKIVDYGLATFQDEKVVIFTKCGTPGFVAPEIITYDEKEPIYGLNVDTFSVGVILHILLVGEQSFPGKSRNTILNKNKECKLDYKSKKYEEIGGDGIDLLSKLLEKNPEKRITARQALSHPFFMKDRPIFKFKKSNRAEIIEYDAYNPKMYQNLEEAEEEFSSLSPRKSPEKAVSSTNFNMGLTNKYIKELQHYEPFVHDQLELSDDLKQERKTQFTILQRGGKNNRYVDQLEQCYEEAFDLFEYEP